LVYLEVNVFSPVAVYQQIMDQIRTLISKGAMASGTPLPPVRQLAGELGINPNTVAKAYQLLELEGTIVTLKRRGAFVGERSCAQAGLATKRRLDEVIDRLLEEAKRLGLSEDEIKRTLEERIKSQQESDHGPGGGL
jgi:GntR family transcriptional regulator